MVLLCCILIIASFFAPLVAVGVPLLVVLDLLALSGAQSYLLAFVALLSVPAAGIVAAELAERAIGRPGMGAGMPQIAAILGMCLALRSGLWSDAVLVSLDPGLSGSATKSALVICALFGKVLFCGAAVVLPAMLLVACFEIFYCWLCPKAVAGSLFPRGALRLCGMLFVVGLGSQLVAGLWWSELGPQALRQLLRGF